MSNIHWLRDVRQLPEGGPAVLPHRPVQQCEIIIFYQFYWVQTHIVLSHTIYLLCKISHLWNTLWHWQDGKTEGWGLELVFCNECSVTTLSWNSIFDYLRYKYFSFLFCCLSAISCIFNSLLNRFEFWHLISTSDTRQYRLGRAGGVLYCPHYSSTQPLITVKSISN